MLCITWLHVENIVVYFLEFENKCGSWSEVVNWGLKTLSSQIKLFFGTQTHESSTHNF